jgi:hypothetical protein
MHNIFMAKFPNNTNQGTPSQGDYCAFPFFRNVGVPLMATLYIPGLNVGLLVWLGTIPNVPNSLDASNLITLCHGNHVDVPLSVKSSPCLSAFLGECIATSNQKSKRNRKRNNRKKKSPTSMSHVGDRLSTYAIHVEYQHPTYASHDGGMELVPACHIRVQSPTSAIHVGDSSSASAIHVEYQHPASTSHVGGKNPTYASHVGGKIPVTASHIGGRFVASTSHVIDQSPTSASHVGDVQPTTTSHARGIDSIEKARQIGHKPKFPCNIYKGDHLTHMYLGIL